MNDDVFQNQPDSGETGFDATASSAKRDWQEPKLQFVEPKLTKHGELKELTGGFFGTFVP